MTNFETIKLGWIVATGDHYTSISFKMMESKVGDRCGDHTNVYDIASGRG